MMGKIEFSKTDVKCKSTSTLHSFACGLKKKLHMWHLEVFSFMLFCIIFTILYQMHRSSLSQILIQSLIPSRRLDSSSDNKVSKPTCLEV